MVVLSVAVLLPLGLSGQSADGQRGLVRDGITVKISEHVYVIPDQNMGLVPNIGIVVGSRATLVVDTGLGPVNAQTVLREVAKVSQGSGLYIVSTHYHPEHAAGEMSFPDGARVIRARAQQQDIDELGTDSLVRFRGISPLIEELLVGVDYRDADTIFDREHELDLGGVRVRIMALGRRYGYIKEDISCVLRLEWYWVTFCGIDCHIVTHCSKGYFAFHHSYRDE